MTAEIENLAANSKDRDGLARLFEFAAAKLAVPLILTSEDDAGEQTDKARGREGGTDDR